jgi:hypothetical protein
MRPDRPALFVLGIVVLLTLTGLTVFLLPLEPSVVRSQFTFTGAAFEAIHRNWTPLAQSRFKSHFAADYIFILLYVIWGYLHGRHAPSVAKLPVAQRRAVAWLLPLAGLADVVENLLHSHFVASTTDAAPEWQYMLAGVAAAAKWACAVAFIVLASIAHRWHKNAA